MRFSQSAEVVSWVLLSHLIVPAAVAEVDVRVRSTQAGPQIFVNGEPVAPRFFFGSRTGGAVAVARPDVWQTVAFDFAPKQHVRGTGTLHFRFSEIPAQYELRNLRIQDVDSGHDLLPIDSLTSEDRYQALWSLWPPADRNSVGRVELVEGAARVTVTPPPSGEWPDLHLHTDIRLSFEEGRTYRCRFEVKSSQPSEIRPAVYSVEGAVWNPVGAPLSPFGRQVGLARGVGIRFVSTSMPSCWHPPEDPDDWGSIDAVMQEIIDEHPQALIVPRVSANAPPWWLARHPESRMVFEDGTPGQFATVSSRAYRGDAAAHLEKLCRHLSEAFPDHFAGIHPCGQNTGEWFYDESWGPLMSGYEPPTREAWQAWLDHHKVAGAASADIPAADRRHAAPWGLLREPSRERDLILFNRFWQREMADTVMQIAAACRRGTGGRKLVLFFYGYLFEFPPLRNGAPYAGHYALSTVLTSPDIDILCAPISYFDRQWQGTGAAMTATESVMLHGKLWLNEDDTRTHRAQTRQHGGVENLAQTHAVLLRNTAQAAVRGFGTWWMDLLGNGWYDDPQIWEAHRRLASLDEALLQRTRPFQPEMALILGEESMLHLTGESHELAVPLVYEARAAFGRSGAPYGQYLLDDVLAGRVAAQLQVFLAAWALTPQQRQELSRQHAPGTTRVWCYAPGYLFEDRGDVEAMSEMSGFAHRPIDLSSAMATPTEAGRRWGIDRPWGPATRIRPLFTALPQSGDETLATYNDGSPAVVLRRKETGSDVFCGVPGWTSALARALARIGGVHLYGSTDANIWVAENYLSVHTMSDGPFRIDTGRTAPVTDAFTGRVLGMGPQVSLEVEAGETYLLRIY